jgi:hypothetical protein
LGHPFAPLIQQTADSSNVAKALSFDASAFFATNAGTPTTAPGVGTDSFAHLYRRLGGAFKVSQHEAETRTSHYLSGGALVASRRLPL